MQKVEVLGRLDGIHSFVSILAWSVLHHKYTWVGGDGAWSYVIIKFKKMATLLLVFFAIVTIVSGVITNSNGTGSK